MLIRPRAILLAVTLALAAAALSACQPHANATVTLTGRGYGHGRGLSQYGAYGYAVDHGWTFRQIVGHYYGGTVHGTVANSTVTVRLSQLRSATSTGGGDYPETRVVGAGTLRVTDAGGTQRFTTTAGALRIVRAGEGRFTVHSGPGCGGPWTVLGTVTSSEARVLPATSADTTSNNLGICEAIGGTRIVRGQVRAVDQAGKHLTVNALPVEDYLRGVLPREVPPSWGNAGGGKGMHALRAQAVAARSYALAENRTTAWKMYDTTSSQVYAGRWYRNGNTLTDLTHPLTDQAITETAGQVRLANGLPARTEFGSSSGGWTAGGQFTAVEDRGDATSSNPNRSWTVQLTMPEIGTKLGLTGLHNITVTERDGRGADGGRALSIRLDHQGGSKTITADQFRSALGLKSTWFTVAFS